MNWPKASIVIATLNHAGVLRKTLKGMLALDYPADFEVIVVNDGSTDNTKEMLGKEFSKEERVKIVELERGGVCRARNAGIELARNEIVVVMDHDCIPERHWLKQMAEGFSSEEIGVVSGYAVTGGTSTAFRKKVLDEIGGFDERFYYYREDTDLVFRALEAGYEAVQVKAEYIHDHKLEKPKGIIGFVRHALKRVKNHQNDVLLFKKHPELGGRFLNVKFGFMVSPLSDFKTVTWLWPSRGGKLRLSSPRDITYLENKSPLHALAIVFMGIVYVLMVKGVRLYGSARFGKLLV